MFLHLDNALFFVKLSNDSNELQLQKNQNLGRRTEIFKLPTTATERRRGEFSLRTGRLFNNLHEFMDFSMTTGLKERIQAFMWKFVNSGFCEINVCNWIIFCDCGKCRNTREEFWFQQWERILSTLSKVPNNNKIFYCDYCILGENPMFFFDFFSESYVCLKHVKKNLHQFQLVFSSGFGVGLFIFWSLWKKCSENFVF